MSLLLRLLRKTIAVGLSLALLDPWGLAARCAQAADLQGIEVGTDELTIRTSEGVRYNAFLMTGPPRLVVELLDTKSPPKARIYEGKGQYLARVRSGQFARKPVPVSRVVLDLNRPVPYRVEERGRELVVRLQEGKVEATVSLKDVPAAAAANSRLAQALPEVSESMPAEELTPQSTPAPREAAAPKAEAPKPKRVADIIDALPTDLEDFHADALDIRDVLRLLGERAKINVVYGTDVTGTITLHLTQVPFRDIFRTVLNMQGLVTEQVGDRILRVMTPAAYQAARQGAALQTKVFQLNYAKAADIRTQLDTIRATEGRRGVTVVDDKTNSVIVTDSPDGLKQAMRLIAQLDRRPRQVLIEAKLVEVEFTHAQEMGIRWSVAYGDTGKIGNQTGQNYIGLANPGDVQKDLAGNALFAFPFNANQPRGAGVLAPIAGAPVGAIGFGRLSQTYNLDAQIQAAASKGKARILSDPKVATLNNQRAVIQITTQLPYVVSTLTSTGVSQQSVQFVTTGITLTVTPTINADGHITLQVKPEVSRPGVREPITGARGANTRSTETTVLVKDGETIVIGGLISDTNNDTVSKVPFLGDIPILGWLFKSRSTDRARQELLVFVTTRMMAE